MAEVVGIEVPKTDVSGAAVPKAKAVGADVPNTHIEVWWRGSQLSSNLLRKMVLYTLTACSAAAVVNASY